MGYYSGITVEAIEDGKIVKVTEDYARREGLPILRKEQPELREPEKKEALKTFDSRNLKGMNLGMEDLRKPLNWKKSQVVMELVDNFQWIISKVRRHRGLSRKQFADNLKEEENTIKLVENGILPSEDFVLINKIQKFLQINLRKDGKDFSESPRKVLDSNPKDSHKVIKGKGDISGDDIEIIEGDSEY